jgi:hypothetical protein
MKLGLIAAAVAAAAGLSGCATITRGTTEAFSVETTPSGASVTTSLGVMCEPTPCVIPKISREAEFTVTISKPGYLTTTHNVTHQTAGGGSAGMAGNVLLGGIIGAAVDANNGATQELIPNPLRLTLEPDPAFAAASASPTPEPAVASASQTQ